MMAALNSCPSSNHGIPNKTSQFFDFVALVISLAALLTSFWNADFSTRSSGGYPVNINSEKIIKSQSLNLEIAFKIRFLLA